MVDPTEQNDAWYALKNHFEANKLDDVSSIPFLRLLQVYRQRVERDTQKQCIEAINNLSPYRKAPPNG